MKVALFTNAYRPIVSGVVNSVDLIRKGLLRAGHIPFVFAPQVPDYKEEHAGVWRFRSMSLTRKVEFPLAIPYSSRIFALIPKMGINVIHVHHPFLLGEVGAYFAKQLGVPLVYTFHTQLEQYAHYVPLPADLVRWAAREHVAAFTKHCDCIICPSPSVRGLLDDYGVTCRVEVLQNAIDVRAFQNASGERLRRELQLEPEHVLAIFTGRLSLEKNLSFLIDAFNQVHARHPQLRLMLLGDGPIMEELKQEVLEYGLEGQVFFPGRVSYDKIPEYYAASDLFVMTSTTEVKPLAVLEGMASSLPVIAVNACGTGDTITHGVDGLLSPCDKAAYCQILEQATADQQLRQKLGASARQTAQQYSLDAYTDKLVALYREVGAKG